MFPQISRHGGIGERATVLATIRLAVAAKIVAGDAVTRAARNDLRPASIPDERQALFRRAEVVEQVAQRDRVLHNTAICPWLNYLEYKGL